MKLTAPHPSQDRLSAQIDELTKCLDLIRCKVSRYEDEVHRSAVDHDCSRPSASGA
jgi:hypothetical protein